MAKKQVKKAYVKVQRAFMFGGEIIVPGEEKKPVIVAVSVALGRELVANGKGEVVEETKGAKDLTVKDEDEFDLGD
ncbi:MAG: hypothetical protein MK185_04705 [Saccharospirillaceae bacterium]|jgi:predicted ribosome-associated RNA-binding protein Tma20|nr:hypothetical protein [Saccharospirillaceae bacterium]